MRHERAVSNIRLAVRAVNRDQTSTIAQMQDSSGAQAGSTPGGRAERTVGAERRALTPLSTASQFTRDGRAIVGNQEERFGARIERTIKLSSRLRMESESRRIVRQIGREDLRSIRDRIVRTFARAKRRTISDTEPGREGSPPPHPGGGGGG